MCTKIVLNYQPESKNLKNKEQNFEIFMIFRIIKFYLTLEEKDCAIDSIKDMLARVLNYVGE